MADLQSKEFKGVMKMILLQAGRPVFLMLLAILALMVSKDLRADSCLELSDRMAGEWKSTTNSTLTFEYGSTTVKLNGIDFPMTFCFTGGNYNVSFFANRQLFFLNRENDPNTVSMFERGRKIFMERIADAPVSQDGDSATAKRDLNNIDIAGKFFIMPTTRYSDHAYVMKESGFAKVLIALANEIDPELKFVIRECGTSNAFFERNSKTVVVCYEILDQGTSHIDQHYRHLPLRTLGAMKSGVVLGVTLHELSHAMIRLLNLPVLGGEEDAADKIATIFLLKIADRDPVMGKHLLVGNLAIAQSWFNIEANMVGNPTIYADEHPLWQQRAYNIVCLAYGKDPINYSDVARHLALPQARAHRCSSEFEQADRSVWELLKRADEAQKAATVTQP